MARYDIKNAAGAVVDRIICPPDQIASFLEAGQSADMTSPHDKSDARAWDLLRAERDKLLAECDWTQVSDAPVNQSSWATYRQALRDLPETTADPHSPVWPVAPK